MTREDVSRQLATLASDPDFRGRCYELVDKWIAVGIGPEALEPVLRFMEGHPELFYEFRGPLVHFIEKFPRKLYKERLVESIKRVPTPQTVGLLNALINATEADAERRVLIEEMERAKSHPLADEGTARWVDFFLEGHE